MNLNIFYDTPGYENQFRKFVERMEYPSITNTHFHQLGYPISTEDSFNLFLLNCQRANSNQLSKTVNQLKEMGTHEQSMLFVLNDIERITQEDIEIVYLDLIQSLKKYISSPKILCVSLNSEQVLHAYKTEGQIESFLYWDPKAQCMKTFQEAVQEDNLENFTEFSRIDKLHRELTQMISVPYFSMKRDPDKLLIIAQQLPSNVLEYFYQYPDLIIQQPENEKSLKLLLKDHDAQLVRLFKYHEVTEEELSLYRDATLLIDTGKELQFFEMENALNKWRNHYSSNIFIPVNTYLLDALKKGNKEKWIQDEKIVIYENGFPYPKTLVKNWNASLAKSSNLLTAYKIILQKSKGEPYDTILH